LQKALRRPNRTSSTSKLEFSELFSLLYVFFAFLDPDSESCSDSTDLTELGYGSGSGSKKHWYNVQVAEVCVQCERVVRQDDARVLLAAPELDTLLDTVHAQQQQFAHLAPDQLTLDPAVPVTFTKDNRVHIGPKVSWLIKRPCLLRYYDQRCGTGTIGTVTFWLVEPEP
jgi:hypothetical protein